MCMASGGELGGGAESGETQPIRGGKDDVFHGFIDQRTRMELYLHIFAIAIRLSPRLSKFTQFSDWLEMLLAVYEPDIGWVAGRSINIRPVNWIITDYMPHMMHSRDLPRPCSSCSGQRQMKLTYSLLGLGVTPPSPKPQILPLLGLTGCHHIWLIFS